MKFGGSSLASVVQMKRVAQKIVAKKKNFDAVVVVVSAPGDMTELLFAKANQMTHTPSLRELDVLLSTGEQTSAALVSMAILDIGYDAISLTGYQAGVFLDGIYNSAHIKDIATDRILKNIQADKIVIITGYQGINEENDIMTLGRGGSDLSAVALAVALKADICEIYTDVDGVYTADPNLVSNARKLSSISYDEMLELSGSGAQVMQARSIEMAKKFNVNLTVSSSFSDETKGTLITKEVGNMENSMVSSITFSKKQSKISILNVPDKYGIAAKIFGLLSRYHINVDIIVQSTEKDHFNDISFTVDVDDLDKSVELLNSLKSDEELQRIKVVYKLHVAKVVLVGIGMRSYPGVAAKMFECLNQEKINIDMISTSEIKIACVIDLENCDTAVQVLHDGFNLEVSNSERDDMKIGEYVQYNISKIIEYCEKNTDEISQLEDKDYSKETFGINDSFLKKIELCVGDKHKRYWVEKHKIGKSCYRVMSQWVLDQKKLFDNYLSKIKNSHGVSDDRKK